MGGAWAGRGLRPGEAPFLATLEKSSEKTKGASPKAAPFLTLYYQNIKLEG